MYYLKIDENNRIIYSAGYFDYIPFNLIPVESYPTEHPITDYLYINGEFIYSPDKKRKIQNQITSSENQITTLKQYLTNTDYVVIKIAEGAATEENYAEVISQREAARASINELESQIEELKKQLDETD
jgi:hypothetical protein